MGVLLLILSGCSFHVKNDGLYEDPEGLVGAALEWDDLPDSTHEGPIYFPVVGAHSFHNDWGAPRGDGSRKHIGIDIMAAKMAPVIAVADGVVAWVRDEKHGECCYLAIDHEGDFQTRYIHLNNDSPGTDDGGGVGIAPEIRPGARVRAGEVIGWVGDSGNAESTAPHLHFEVWYQKRPTNPYKFLVSAKHIPLSRGQHAAGDSRN